MESGNSNKEAENVVIIKQMAIPYDLKNSFDIRGTNTRHHGKNYFI